MIASIPEGSSPDPKQSVPIYLWDAASGQELVGLVEEITPGLRALVGYGMYYDLAPDAIAWSSDSQKLVSWALDSHFSVWDARRGSLISRYTKGMEEFNALPKKPLFPEVEKAVWSPDGKRLLGWGNFKADGRAVIHVWNPEDGQPVSEYNYIKKDILLKITWSSDSQTVAAGDITQVFVWDANSGQPLYTYSSNGKRIATYEPQDKSAEMIVWDAVTGRNRTTYLTQATNSPPVVDPFMPMDWSPDGTRISIALQDGTVAAWKVH
jgi:WD40 repeat protein